MSDSEQEHKPWTIRGVPSGTRAAIKSEAAAAELSIAEQIALIVHQWQQQTLRSGTCEKCRQAHPTAKMITCDYCGWGFCRRCYGQGSGDESAGCDYCRPAATDERVHEASMTEGVRPQERRA